MTATRSVTFTPLILDGAADAAIVSGYYLISPTASFRDGAGRVMPLPFQAVVDSDPVVLDLPVTPNDLSWALKVAGTFAADTGDTYSTVEYVTVPAGSDPMDYDDLERVSSPGPVVDDVTPAIELRIDSLETHSTVVVIQSGGAYPAPLPVAYGAVEFRGSVDPASQFVLTGNYQYKWVQLP